MRTLILIAWMAVTAARSIAQQMPSSADDSLLAPKAALAADSLLYRDAVRAYNANDYVRAEKRFRKAFATEPTEEGARYLYYSILLQGHDLEAAQFQAANRNYTFALAPHRNGLESIYADAGPRISANSNADNILYADAGALLRLSGSVRLWQSLTFLKQDNNPGSFKQYNYFGSLIIYAGSGWYLQPSFHYAAVPYNFVVNDTANVNYVVSYPLDHHDTLYYKTAAVQRLATTVPGTTHFLHFSLPVSRRFGAFVLEAEPSLHYVSGTNTATTQYTSIGTTDSFENKRYLGSRPFSETGGSRRDTAYSSSIFQGGVAITYRLPLPGEPVTLRGAVYSLWSTGNSAELAYHISAAVRLHKDFRLYLTCLHKGAQPLALRAEGQYFNFYNPINIRAGISFIAFPLRRFSPTLTYHYEHDTRLQDGAALVYHSIYLTLKYNL